MIKTLRSTPPCTLEVYTRVYAGMTLLVADPIAAINYQLVLLEHGLNHQSWLECEAFWTPRIALAPDSETDVLRFQALLKQLSYQIVGFAR